MKSLRKHLLVWLVPVFLGGGGDRHRVHVLHVRLHGQLVHGQPDAGARRFAHRGDDRSAGVAAADGSPRREGRSDRADLGRAGRSADQLLSGARACRCRPRTVSRKSKLGSQRWRVYSVHTPGRSVQSIQNLEFRADVINKQALQAGLPIALLIPISAWVLWFAACRAMRKLETVARAAAAQDENTIGELPTKDVPSEISPLVHRRQQAADATARCFRFAAALRAGRRA